MSFQGPGGGISGTSNQFSVGYAQSAGSATNINSANGINGTTWAWSGQPGSPGWLWGGNAAGQYAVWQPGNLQVAYAGNAGYAGYAGYAENAKRTGLSGGYVIGGRVNTGGHFGVGQAFNNQGYGQVIGAQFSSQTPDGTNIYNTTDLGCIVSSGRNTGTQNPPQGIYGGINFPTSYSWESSLVLGPSSGGQHILISWALFAGFG